MLDATPREYKERSGLVVNPAKTCQPVGAMYAALGIHRCLPHSHGSQGCCAYHRKFLTRHFRDPVTASTSSFTEGSAVFGGGANLKTAIKNVFAIYDPDIIAIHTTCLSETIGDDIPSNISQAQVPEGKLVIHANTPSYQGSHVTGFSNMVKGMVKYLSKREGINGKVNVIPGFVNPSDMREMKRMMDGMGIEYILFPDTSGVMDAPMTGRYDMYPAGGTTIRQLEDTGNSMATLAMGHFASFDAAHELERKCHVPFQDLITPIGVKATDAFLMALSRLTGKQVPACLEEERGQVVDLMVDCHYHYHGKTVALFGDPDFVIAMTDFLLTLGMIPKHVVTGTPGELFESTVKGLREASGVTGGHVKAGGDLFSLHQWMKEEPVDLLIGGTHGKYIARAEDVPFIRAGFPILDRSVHAYLPLVGYRGALRVIEMISNALLDRQDRDCPDEDFELIQ
jgi:nitrogenase molybdenum-iron protein beta chain